MIKKCCSLLFLFFLACSPAKKETQILTPGLYYPSRDLPELFEEVQMSGVYSDSKTFVDCVPKHTTVNILSDFHRQKQRKNFDLKVFLDENFVMSHEREARQALDESKDMSRHIENHWDFLVRPADDTTQYSSLIPLPDRYVVPGGRFREVYYWDSYFTMLGLGVSGKIELMKNMLDNFAYLIDEVGFVPNGNRTYYLGRSQPPYFSSMVMLYAEYQGIDDVLVYLPHLEKEYDFWMEGVEQLKNEGDAFRRVVQLNDQTILNRYWDEFATPRPESYKEDYTLAKGFSAEEKKSIYRNLRAAAESGWDFSSRWLSGSNDLVDIQTTEIIPVDLNCLLYHLEQTIAKLYGYLGHAEKEQIFSERAQRRKVGILHYCWNAEIKSFTDYHFTLHQSTGILSLASAYPLYFQLATDEQAKIQARTYKKHFLFPGGLATSISNTGQQWDYPNGWAPMQWLTIKGLINYKEDILAEEIEKRWLWLNEKVYRNTGKMMEKYNVVDTSLIAGGGEYPNQDGFGWTNGVAIALIKGEDKY